MKFILTFRWKPDTKAQSVGIERFTRTGGQPPENVKLLGRWTRADFSGGYDLLETDDAQGLLEFALTWSDLMDLEVVPVLEDDATARALQKMPMTSPPAPSSSADE